MSLASQTGGAFPDYSSYMILPTGEGYIPYDGYIFYYLDIKHDSLIINGLELSSFYSVNSPNFCVVPVKKGAKYVTYHPNIKLYKV